MTTTPEIEARLAVEKNIWLATTRANGMPHLIPIWFVWHAERAYLCTSPKSVKARNMDAQPRVMFALENGNKPGLAEADAARLPQPFPADLVAAYKAKYGWDISTDSEYGAVYELRVLRWLSWDTGSAQ